MTSASVFVALLGQHTSRSANDLINGVDVTPQSLFTLPALFQNNAEVGGGGLDLEGKGRGERGPSIVCCEDNGVATGEVDKCIFSPFMRMCIWS